MLLSFEHPQCIPVRPFGFSESPAVVQGEESSSTWDKLGTLAGPQRGACGKGEGFTPSSPAFRLLQAKVLRSSVRPSEPSFPLAQWLTHRERRSVSPPLAPRSHRPGTSQGGVRDAESAGQFSGPLPPRTGQQELSAAHGRLSPQRGRRDRMSKTTLTEGGPTPGRKQRLHDAREKCTLET